MNLLSSLPASLAGELTETLIQPARPRRGSERQVWRANIIVPVTNAQCICWAFRRVRSTIKSQIELVASKSLRERLGLSDGVQVQVVIHEGGDDNPTQST